MREIFELYKKTGELHHAYLLEGDSNFIREELFGFFENELNHPVRGNPDFWHESSDSLSIGKARELIEMQSMRPVACERKIFVIEARTINIEAQNALLKMFEEPASNTHFFIISPSSEVFLPTLKSRLFIISSNKDSASHKNSKLAEEFLKANYSKRFEVINPIIEEKNRSAAIELLDGLIKELAKTKTNRNEKISDLLSLRSYLNDKSSSVKLVLEHCSAVL